jgi:hypothetical protein
LGLQFRATSKLRRIVAGPCQCCPAPRQGAGRIAVVSAIGRFLIDPDFVIRAMEVLTSEVGRNPEELVRQVMAFQPVRATGEVTPSGVQPGQVTLTPGPQLVGKVWQQWKPGDGRPLLTAGT